jgi:hypothetical protein
MSSLSFVGQKNISDSLIIDYLNILVQYNIRKYGFSGWEKLIDKGLGPLIYKYIKYPGAITGMLKKRVYLSLARSVLIGHEIDEIINFLNFVNIIPILIKGSELGLNLYGDYYLREMDDIYIRIDSRELDNAVKEFVARGYIILKEFNGSHITFKKNITGSVPVEVHTSLYRKDVVSYNILLHKSQRKYYTKGFSLDRSMPLLTKKKLKYRVLCIDENLEYLCFHFLKHRCEPGKWALDLLLLFNRQKEHKNFKKGVCRIVYFFIKDIFLKPCQFSKFEILRKLLGFSAGRIIVFFIFRILDGYQGNNGK